MLGYNTYQKLKVINRFNYIVLVFFKAGFKVFLYKIGLKKHIPWFHRALQGRKQPVEARMPYHFRRALEDLGPVFVKFGQILSTRSDLLPPEYILELEKLQSHVPPFSFEKAKAIVEHEFKKPLNLVFKDFEKQPFASASLGQVYRAKLLTTGETVAVKVQRPGAKKQIQLDTQVLLMLASFAEKHIEGVKQYSPMEVVQEFRRWTLNELDYHKEGVNCEIFANFFKDNPHIYSPKVFWEYTRSSVLTLEYIEGRPLNKIISEDIGIKNRKNVAKYIADAFMRQYFEFGFFHADPHPGNIFILKNSKVMFLDFGMVGYLDGRLTALASGIFIALMQRDVEKLVSLALQMEGDYDEESDNTNARATVKVNAFRKQLTELLMQWSDMAKPGEFTRLFYNLVNASVQNGVAVPVDLVMLSKSIMTLDIVMQQLDGNLCIEEWEGPMVEKIIENRLKADKLKARAQNAALIVDDLLKRLPDTTAEVISNLEKGKFGMEVNASQLLEYERMLNTNSKISTYGTLLAAIVIAFALIYQSTARPIVLGWTIPQIGLYAGIVLIFLFFISNKKRA